MQIWETLSQALRVVKPDTTASTFPLQALTKIFVQIPDDEVASGLACWNLIKQHYITAMNKASARLIDLHFQTQVFEFHVTCCYLLRENLLAKRKPSPPRKRLKERKRGKRTRKEERKRSRRRRRRQRKRKARKLLKILILKLREKVTFVLTSLSV